MTPLQTKDAPISSVLLYSGSKNRATSTIQYEPAILHFYYRVTTSCKTSILQNHTTNYFLITSLS